MPLPIPTINLGPWCQEVIEQCHTSLENRRMRGASYRNLYLTGSDSGEPQTYKKTYAYIQTLAALLYSPVGLRFNVAPYGPAGPRDRSMGRAAATTLLEYFRGGSIDTTIEDAVEWALVKGKTFIQLDWSRGGLSAYMIQPETMGVLRDDISSLDKQDAFVHSTWLTEARFADRLAGHSKRKELLADIKKFVSDGEGRPDTADNSRQVMIGGQLYPYRPQGSTGAGQGRGIANWLQAPMPELDKTTMEKLIRLDELWVWDGSREDWTTFQLVGDVVIEPTKQHRNIFAEGYEDEKQGRRIRRAENSDHRSPLSGHHPFVEICPNPLPDYFWGWSEIQNVGMIQLAINNRVDGINRLLRRQEDPSWIIAGLQSNAARAKATLRRPGGYLVDAAPNIKVEKMSPDLPAGLWESLHELEQMFDIGMGGFPPVVQGQGESGVRSQGHAETLVRMASTRSKDRALGIERQIEEVGGLSLDMLREFLADQLPYWIKENEVGPFKGMELDPLLYEPPAPGLVALPFQMHQLSDRFRVTVDSHSSSPIFAHEARELAMLLSARGAIGPEDLIRLLHPPEEEVLIADLETREANKAAAIAALPPELRAQALTGHKPPRRSAAH
jgi:hypothetical protein